MMPTTWVGMNEGDFIFIIATSFYVRLKWVNGAGIWDCLVLEVFFFHIWLRSMGSRRTLCWPRVVYHNIK